jgi:hypothetical protein
MTTAARGTILAGRYRLEDRTHNSPDGAHWRAVDSTLDRRVSVRVMRPGHPFAAAAADAARRVALIDDSRLVRVLDVGQDGDVGFVVSEEVDGDTLASLVERSPLAPPAVRRIIGEVSEGLTAAAARGLHHLQLTPRSVIVCRDGSVKIAGTAVEAAATGLEPDHAASANRTDAVALVALLYSGLTGRWPLAGPGFPPAPRGEGGNPVPPADLVPGIPNDLDTLCVVTLGGAEDGPRTPAELVGELSPWLSAEEAPLRAAARRAGPETPTGPPGPDSPLRFKSSPIRRGGFKPIRPMTPMTPGASASANDGPAAEPGQARRRSASLFTTPSVAATGSLPIPKEPAGGGPRRMDSLFTQQTVYPDPEVAKPAAAEEIPAERDPSSTIRAIPPIMTARPAAYDAPAHDATAHGATAYDQTAYDQDAYDQDDEPAEAHRLEPAYRVEDEPIRDEAVDQSLGTETGRPSGYRPERPASWTRPLGPPMATNADEPLVPWGPGWQNEGGPPSALEATGPFPILIPPATPPREQSRWVIFAVAIVLVLGLVVAFFSLRDLGSSGDVKPTEVGASLPTSTAAVTAAPTTEAAEVTPTATASATPSPSAAGPAPQIGKIRSIDPQGNGDENTDVSPLAVDGKDSTVWHSQNYTSAQFGSLKKGVGLALKLKKSAAVSSVTIDFNGTGGAVEIRTGDDAGLDGSTLVGKATMKDGEVTVKTDDAKPSNYVILWFTKLSSVDGQHKLEVSEVRLK